MRGFGRVSPCLLRRKEENWISSAVDSIRLDLVATLGLRDQIVFKMKVPSVGAVGQELNSSTHSRKFLLT